MADFATMKASVRAVLRDSEAAFISDNQIGEWLNEANLDLCTRLSLLQTTAAGVTSVTSTISLPSNLSRIISLVIEDEFGEPVAAPQNVSNDIFLSYANSNDVPPTYIYRVYEDVIDIYPAATDVDYVLEYIKTPTVMSGGTDLPGIPSELHFRLVNYARAEAKLMEGELNESDRYRAAYERGIPGPTATTERRFPGPISLVMEPSYFD